MQIHIKYRKYYICLNKCTYIHARTWLCILWSYLLLDFLFLVNLIWGLHFSLEKDVTQVLETENISNSENMNVLKLKYTWEMLKIATRVLSARKDDLHILRRSEQWKLVTRGLQASHTLWQEVCPLPSPQCCSWRNGKERRCTSTHGEPAELNAAYFLSTRLNHGGVHRHRSCSHHPGRSNLARHGWMWPDVLYVELLQGSSTGPLHILQELFFLANTGSQSLHSCDAPR